MEPALEQLRAHLARLATHFDVTGEWPQASLDHLTAADAWRWVIPRHYDGRELDGASLLKGYMSVAGGCMSCCLILTQHHRACELIAEGENPALAAELLPRFASVEWMTSVGISQITTSRQGERPALTAREDGEGFRLQGYMPWVTAANHCKFIVTAAVLADGKQILAAVPNDAPGVTIDPPMKLMALQSSCTSEVHCRNVMIDRRHLVRGPTDHVLKARSPIKPLVVASCGIGLAGSLLRQIQGSAERQGQRLAEFAEELGARYDAVCERIQRFAEGPEVAISDEVKTELRVAVNDLLVRLAAAAITYTKGSGLLRQREPQRLAREALFFLVWSAPEEVRAGTLAGLLERPPLAEKSMEWA